MNKIQLKQLIREEIRRRLHESDASDEAKRIGLHYAGWGRYMDDSGKIVAKTVQGKLTRLDMPEEPEEPGINKKVDAQLQSIFKKAGHKEYEGDGSKQVVPGWNKNKQLAQDDIPFDANGEETVDKLLAMVGDPAKLIRWLVKTFHEETPNGKQRILQYLNILKTRGIGEESVGADSPTEPRSPKHDGDLFRF